MNYILVYYQNQLSYKRLEFEWTQKSGTLCTRKSTEYVSAEGGNYLERGNSYVYLERQVVFVSSERLF